jgi:hypothetical protein
MSNVISLDQIIAAVDQAAPAQSAEVKGEMIARIILAYNENTAAMAKPTQTKTAPKQTQKVAPTGLAWKNADASAKQVARIERCEEAILDHGKALGIRRILRGEARSAAMATAGTASMYYRNLTDYTKGRGIKF